MKLSVKQLEISAFTLQINIDDLNSFHRFDLCTNSRKDNNMLL